MSDAIKSWHKLDNAAKIFPPTSGKSDTKVFRFSCELHEEIDGERLQSALDAAINDFPNFQYMLKRGVFWFYLEQCGLRPLVHEEDAPPCGTIYPNSRALLFDVTWYKKRINLEVYHALTDGTGALLFLKTLTLYYLKLKHPNSLQHIAGIDYDASEAQKMTDSFNKYYDRGKSGTKVKNPTAYQIRGAKESEWRLKIIEGCIPTDSLLKKARAYNTTITVFTTALLMRAIYGEMSVRDRKKPVVISVPVNLRNYFDSKSTLNFFSAVNIEYDFYNNGDTLEDVIQGLKDNFKKRLNEEYLQNRMNQLLALEYNYAARVVPLALKNIIMNIVYTLSIREFTASISNLGRITMPEETAPYIRRFNIFSSTDKVLITMCSYENNLSINITSPFVSTDIQRAFFRQLTQMGISAEVTANHLKRP